METFRQKNGSSMALCSTFIFKSVGEKVAKEKFLLISPFNQIEQESNETGNGKILCYAGNKQLAIIHRELY